MLSLKYLKKLAKEQDLNIFSKKDFITQIDLDYASESQQLSEDFIREFKDKVDWYYISIDQKLSEDFIRDFQDKVYWDSISVYQKLSEEFIREFKDKVDWENISSFQKLSENFIREFKSKVDWDCILQYQKLSEDFIEEFKNNIPCFSQIARYQKVSKVFIKKYNLYVPDTCWLYKSTQYKIDYVRKRTPYEVIDNSYIIAYKSTDKYGRSLYDPRYKYLNGRSYRSSCDSNIDYASSFGLAAWTKEEALNYCNDGKLFKVLIFVKDIGAITKDNKIRCRKFIILNEEKKI